MIVFCTTLYNSYHHNQRLVERQNKSAQNMQAKWIETVLYPWKYKICLFLEASAKITVDSVQLVTENYCSFSHYVANSDPDNSFIALSLFIVKIMWTPGDLGDIFLFLLNVRH